MLLCPRRTKRTKRVVKKLKPTQSNRPHIPTKNWS